MVPTSSEDLSDKVAFAAGTLNKGLYRKQRHGQHQHPFKGSSSCWAVAYMYSSRC